MIYNPEASSRHTMVTIHGANDVPGHSDNVRMMTGAAQNNENSAVNYFRITYDNGNISNAQIKLYGVQ
jgi:translation elongation factor EF-Tu-like GTPase